MTENSISQTENVYIIKPLFEKNDDSADEICALVESAGAKVCGIKMQFIREVNPATFIGSGKLEEIKEELVGSAVNLIVFDGELSPSQTLNIRALLDKKVIDRTTLILDIFALNAKSTEGKLQVELAQLNYIYPRLRGKGAELSQQGGGIGTRGPGETQLETDRRHIRRRIDYLESALKAVENRRNLQSRRREKNNVKTVALVGYTNTGKSTLLNRLTGAGVLVKNQLFATLDPTMRKLTLKNSEVLLVDTVGFVRNIPHHLIEAFKSTLETAVQADLIVIVCDAKGDYKTQLSTTEKTLEEIGANGPKLIVFNKCDGIVDFSTFPKDAVFVSALYGQGISSLRERMDDFFKENYVALSLTLSYEQYGVLRKLKDDYILKSVVFTDSGVNVDISIPKQHYLKFRTRLKIG